MPSAVFRNIVHYASVQLDGEVIHNWNAINVSSYFEKSLFQLTIIRTYSISSGMSI